MAVVNNNGIFLFFHDIIKKCTGNHQCTSTNRKDWSLLETFFIALGWWCIAVHQNKSATVKLSAQLLNIIYSDYAYIIAWFSDLSDRLASQLGGFSVQKRAPQIAQL